MIHRPEIDSFPPEIARRLKTYVYRLIDPRNGETFYVGKGQGDRVFHHIREAQGLEGDDLDNKMKRIRQIHAAGFEVSHVIHRHGMDEAKAFEVEAALMEAYPGVTNIMGGVGSSEFGVMHALEIIQRYSAIPAVFQHNVLMISINKSVAERSMYDATRSAWVLKKSKAEQAEFVLATVQGEIREAYVAHRWLEVTAENFPDRDPIPGRFGFEGEKASPEIRALYVGRRIPDEFRKPGAANPIKYNW